MKVGLVRRGYSASGGAERYLKRLGEALAQADHEAVLFSSPEWPAADWNVGEVVPVQGRSPSAFADNLAKLDPSRHCDFLYSLERIDECDAYRAGDGVHRAWLQRRKKFEAPWRSVSRVLNRKHREILRLEEQLMADQKAGTIIVNSNMVRQEILDHYGYPLDRIRTVYNGVPIQSFRRSPEAGKRLREEHLLADKDLLVLFAGSGWGRKGLKFATRAVEQLARKQRAVLLVAGKGKRLKYSSKVARFVGETDSMMPLLEAADIFILPTTYDPFSNACLEAMAYGVPVVTTTANGFHEIIENKQDGWIVDNPANIDDLAAGLEFWSDKERREQAAATLSLKAQQFSIEANLRQTMQAIGLNLHD